MGPVVKYGAVVGVAEEWVASTGTAAAQQLRQAIANGARHVVTDMIQLPTLDLSEPITIHVEALPPDRKDRAQHARRFGISGVGREFESRRSSPEIRPGEESLAEALRRMNPEKFQTQKGIDQ